MLTKDMIQGLLSLYERPSYLEIGVFKGATFVPIEAARKVGVDPNFLFDADAMRAQQPNAELHSCTSDEYFGRIVDPDERFDVIFLDGLHTFEQTLRDLNNAIFFLKPDGVVRVDDVIPTSWGASIKTMAESYRVKDLIGELAQDGNWMGDVYRLVFYVDSFFQQFTFRTLADNHGQLIGWRSRRTSVPERDVEAISRLTYADVLQQRDMYRLTPFQEVRAEVQQHVQASRRAR